MILDLMTTKILPDEIEAAIKKQAAAQAEVNPGLKPEDKAAAADSIADMMRPIVNKFISAGGDLKLRVNTRFGTLEVVPLQE